MCYNTKILIEGAYNVKYLLGPMRLPFLILTPMVPACGIATASWSGAVLNALHIILIMIGAVGAHISVNALNEYHDLKSGLDFLTPKTPFSGGSGTLPEKPEKAPVALATGLISLGITTVSGCISFYASGIGLLPLGLFGLFIIFTYTKWITKNPFLCLVAPGLGFGPLMVMGTNFVLTGSYSWTAFIASLVPGFLVSDLLLLNQFPDMEADKTVGRRHLPIVMGRRSVAWVYAAFLAASYNRYPDRLSAGQTPGSGVHCICHGDHFLSHGKRCFKVCGRHTKTCTLSQQECNNQPCDPCPARHRPVYRLINISFISPANLFRTFSFFCGLVQASHPMVTGSI
jgi:1,4-dihydroxy-2-naphthoate octaprenyltransferase